MLALALQQFLSQVACLDFQGNAAASQQGILVLISVLHVQPLGLLKQGDHVSKNRDFISYYLNTLTKPISWTRADFVKQWHQFAFD